MWSGIVREGNLIFNNLKPGVIKDNTIILTKVPINVIAVVSSVDHLLGKRAIKTVLDVNKSLSTALQ